MNKTELKTIRDALLAQKSLILNKTHEFKRMQGSGLQASDEVDVLTEDLANNLNIQLHERDISSLAMIEKALGKMADGTYGECESCRQKIDMKRLRARPFASFCIECMEDLEIGSLSFQ